MNRLTKDYGQIVLNSNISFVEGIPDIEIYDDWRE